MNVRGLSLAAVRSNLVSKMIVAAVVVTAFGAAARSADAQGLYYENRTSEVVYLCVANREFAGTDANGVYSPGSWRIDGWYTLRPGEKKQIMRGDLDNRYYYYYAHTASNSLVWDGDYEFLIHPNLAFTHYKVDDQGYHSWKEGSVVQGFKELDTGDSLEFTLQLTER